jgi:hypothetical protein
MKRLIFIMLLLLTSCSKRVREPVYKVSQELYSSQGIDSIRTIVFYYHKEEALWGKSIFIKKNTLDNKVKDSLEANKFITTYKNFK